MTSCATCDHWSPYLPGLGECMAYAKARQDAMVVVAGEVFRRDWPQRPAHDTEATFSCGQWTGRLILGEDGTPIAYAEAGE